MTHHASGGFEQEIPPHFCCSICYKISLPYTTLAPCGHTLCGACAAKVFTCPECRSAIDGRVHSRQLDDVVRQSLQYKCRSCGWVGSGDERGRHDCRAAGGEPREEPPAWNQELFWLVSICIVVFVWPYRETIFMGLACLLVVCVFYWLICAPSVPQNSHAVTPNPAATATATAARSPQAVAAPRSNPAATATATAARSPQAVAAPRSNPATTTASAARSPQAVAAPRSNPAATATATAARSPQAVAAPREIRVLGSRCDVGELIPNRFVKKLLQSNPYQAFNEELAEKGRVFCCEGPSPCDNVETLMQIERVHDYLNCERVHFKCEGGPYVPEVIVGGQPLSVTHLEPTNGLECVLDGTYREGKWCHRGRTECRWGRDCRFIHRRSRKVLNVNMHKGIHCSYNSNAPLHHFVANKGLMSVLDTDSSRCLCRDGDECPDVYGCSDLHLKSPEAIAASSPSIIVDGEDISLGRICRNRGLWHILACPAVEGRKCSKGFHCKDPAMCDYIHLLTADPWVEIDHVSWPRNRLVDNVGLRNALSSTLPPKICQWGPQCLDVANCHLIHVATVKVDEELVPVDSLSWTEGLSLLFMAPHYSGGWCRYGSTCRKKEECDFIHKNPFRFFKL